jgi:hypothetical protein
MLCIAAVSFGAIGVRQLVRHFTKRPSVNTSNIKSLSAKDFQWHLKEHHFLPRDDSFETIFRPLQESPTAAARAKSGGGMSDEEVLGEVQQIDFTPEALLAGPHVECITYEGSLKFTVPTLHSVQVFRNRFIDIWVLREKTYTEKKWRSYALAQDKTVAPNVARYFQMAFDDSGKWVTRGATCYECHSSGPRALRGIRADLISGQRYADEMNADIRRQDFVDTRFVKGEPRKDYGEELHLEACTGCHSSDAQRGPLYRFHWRSVEVLTQNANMPPGKGSLSQNDLTAIAEWLGPAESKTR